MLKGRRKIKVVDMPLKIGKRRAEGAGQQVVFAADQVTGAHVVVFEQGQQLRNERLNLSGIKTAGDLRCAAQFLVSMLAPVL